MDLDGNEYAATYVQSYSGIVVNAILTGNSFSYISGLAVELLQYR